jgi:ABC-type bacteriocin/lantibiotic exporter with double-glycine peptidase domain
MFFLSRVIAASSSAAVVLFAASLCNPGPALARAAVPFFAQKTSSDCGRAVLASLAARQGGNPAQYYNRVPEPADAARGYSIPEMRRYGARLGVSLSLRAPSGVMITGQCSASAAVTNYFRQLARSAASGRPVVVPVSSGFGGHYLILTGASGDTFSMIDPASGPGSISSSTLASRMCGFGYVALQAD